MRINTGMMVSITEANQNFSKVARMVDENKRIGVLAILLFLELNGMELDCNDDALIQIGRGLADGSMHYNGLPEWIKLHRK